MELTAARSGVKTHQHSIHQYLKTMKGKQPQKSFPVISLMSSKNRNIPVQVANIPLLFDIHKLQVIKHERIVCRQKKNLTIYPPNGDALKDGDE